MGEKRPRIVVFTTLFPHGGQPGSGVFIRERMFRVGHKLPIVVVAPVPWFPFQSLIRYWRPHFRPHAPRHETQDGVEIYCPRFFSVPGIFKSLDGLFMALGSLPLLLKLRRTFGFDLIDAHFAYPDGYAATLIGRWLDVPVTITLRGTEVPMARSMLKRRKMLKAVRRAARVFSVATSLKMHMVALGADADKILVVGNGVDIDKFKPVSRADARKRLSIPPTAQVLISVGGLVERKGFHRVIECLPELMAKYPEIVYIIVGGASREGDWSVRLRQLVEKKGLQKYVHFLGELSPGELKYPLSASDVFVLSTRNEGWANVFLEAMACGLPVVTTNVGGNAEVVSDDCLGEIVPFGDRGALAAALDSALSRGWDHDKIINHARKNSWDTRVDALVKEFQSVQQRQLNLSAGRLW